jgi:hypothetical protein
MCDARRIYDVMVVFPIAVSNACHATTYFFEIKFVKNYQRAMTTHFFVFLDVPDPKEDNVRVSALI